MMLIDTDKARQHLLHAGVAEEQASAHLDILRMVDEQIRAELATKEDLANLERRLTRLLLIATLTTIGIVLAGMWALLEFYL